MALSYKTRSEKLQTVTQALGYPHPIALLYQYLDDAIVPGICINEKCSYINGVLWSEEGGYCSNCETYSVQSVMVLSAVE